MSDADEPGALTAEGLFRLVTDEAYADGVLEDRERQLMITLAKFLRLDPARAKEISRESKAAYQAGELEHAERLSTKRLYQRILVAVMADGEIDEYEAQLLVGLKKLFGIEEDEHEGMLGAAKTRTATAEAEPAPAPVAAPEAPGPKVTTSYSLEELPQRAAVAFQHGDPGRMAKVRLALEDLGTPTEAQAPTLARALANMAILSMTRGDGVAVEEAVGHLRELLPFAGDAVVQEEALITWGCFLEWLANLLQSGRGGSRIPAQVRAAVDQILSLLEARTPTTKAIDSVCSSLGAAGLVHLVSLADHERILAVSAALRGLSAAYRDDDAVQFTIAKLMVNGAIMVGDSWPGRDQGGGFFGALKSLVGKGERTPRDDCLDDFAATMEELLRHAPDSPEVRDAQGRFQRQVRRKLKAPAGGPPVPDTPQVPGRTPVPDGWTDAAPGWPAGGMPRAGYASPMAAVDALEDAYSAGNMDAYLSALMALYILDTEMGYRQATYGRLARAVGRQLAERPALTRAGMIGTKLRHLVEDLGDSGNPVLEREARALEDVLQAASRG